MQTITTRYLGPTNTKGSRYKATSRSGKSLTLSADYSLNADQNHARAATALRDSLDWSGSMVGGETVTGMCWVFVGRSPRID